MTATRTRTVRPLRPAQQAIIERWKPSIDALIEANWPRLEQIGLDTAGPLAGPWSHIVRNFDMTASGSTGHDH